MTKQKDYWFKAKKYGWGWGLPLTLRGWISYGVFVAVWLAALSVFSNQTMKNDPTALQVAIFTAVMVLDVVGLVYVSIKYGEPPKWRWGNKRSASNPKK